MRSRHAGEMGLGVASSPGEGKIGRRGRKGECLARVLLTGFTTQAEDYRGPVSRQDAAGMRYERIFPPE